MWTLSSLGLGGFKYFALYQELTKKSSAIARTICALGGTRTPNLLIRSQSGKVLVSVTECQIGGCAKK